MKIRAVGRNLLIRMKTEVLEESAAQGMIVIPKEVMDKEMGGCQIAVILSVGESAFDDEPPEVRETITVGREIITARYPGGEIGTDVRATDQKVNEYRMIKCSEVQALVTIEGEVGADV